VTARKEPDPPIRVWFDDGGAEDLDPVAEHEGGAGRGASARRGFRRRRLRRRRRRRRRRQWSHDRIP
jgi:hypothetical protein